MRTPQEIIDFLYEYLSNSDLKKIISGGIYPRKRPKNSDKEDIVIGGISFSGDSVQRGTINVNIYIPEISVKIDNEIQTQPNGPRMREIEAVAIPLLRELYFGGDCSVWSTGYTEIKEPELAVWKVNIRLEVRIHDTDKK